MTPEARRLLESRAVADSPADVKRCSLRNAAHDRLTVLLYAAFPDLVPRDEDHVLIKGKYYHYLPLKVY